MPLHRGPQHPSYATDENVTYWAFATFLSIGFVLKHNTIIHTNIQYSTDIF